MEIIPHSGIGKIRLGMSQAEAEQCRQAGMQIDYDGSPPVVAFIQIARGILVQYRALDLLDEPADEVVAAIVRLEGLDAADFPPGKHSYLFPHLNLVLWRGCVSEDPDDEQGYFFDCVSIHSPDYYQGAELEQLRRKTTHKTNPTAVSDSDNR